jgi:hypothetical protein
MDKKAIGPFPLTVESFFSSPSSKFIVRDRSSRAIFNFALAS